MHPGRRGSATPRGGRAQHPGHVTYDPNAPEYDRVHRRLPPSLALPVYPIGQVRPRKRRTLSFNGVPIGEFKQAVITGLVLLAILVSAAPAWAQCRRSCPAPSVPTPSATAIAASVKVCYDNAPAKKAWCGSGTLIGQKDGWAFVVTNQHVAPDACGTLTVHLPSGRSYDAVFVASDAVHDLTILGIAAEGTPAPVPLAQRAPAGGDPVCQVGYTFGLGLRQRAGVCFGPAFDKTQKAACLILELPTDHGDSGSGVFDTSGQLCAIVYGSDFEGGHTACAGVEDLRRLVDGK